MSRALYGAEIDGGSLTLDLQVFDDETAFARAWLSGLGTDLVGYGTLREGELELTFHFPRTGDDPYWEAHSVLFDARLLAAGEDAELPYDGYEAAEFGPMIALLRGTAEVAWDADHDPIEALLEFTGLDGVAPVTHDLVLVRQTVNSSMSVRQGRIHAEASFPYFVRGPFVRINSFIEASQRTAIDEFVAFGRDTFTEGGGWGMELVETISVTGSAGPFLSLLGYSYAFTGGAHGNTFADSYLLEIIGDELIRWQVADLFAPGSDWVETIGPLVLADLAEQGAMWVVDSEVVEVTERDLRVATLGSAGLTFHFDPYLMGPYVQGSFSSTVPYSRLLDLARDSGPLTAFALEFAVR